jgi:hypothetical protein
MLRRTTWQRLTARLALLALAVQLVASFAHVHAEDFAGLLSPGLTRVTATDGAPSGHSDPDHLTCDICASVHLAGTLVVPVPPALVLPRVTSTALAVLSQPFQSASASSAFDARGPPQA